MKWNHKYTNQKIREEILEWNTYLPEVKKQSLNVLVNNILFLIKDSMENNRRETLFDNKEDNVVMDVSIANFIEAIEKDLFEL